MDYTSVGIHDFYTFVLTLARVSGLLVAAPILGNRAIPKMVKAGFALILSLAVTPLIVKQTGPVPEHLLLLAGGVMQDALFGLALGYVTRLLFSAVEMAGYLMDTQMGFGFINLINPFTEQQASLMSAFQYQVSTVLFLLANGHLTLIAAVTDSFAVVPPGAVSLHGGFGLSILPMLHLMFALGFRMAIPAVGVLLVVDVAFGLVARMVPQVNVFIVGLPAKILIGLATVAFLLPTLGMIVAQIIAGTSVGVSALLAGAK